MRMIPWSPIARRSTDDPAVEEKLLGLSLRDCCNYAAYCAAENRPRDLASFAEWEAQRLPGRGANPVMTRPVA
ncbi:MAG: hypothetical protein DCC69_06570 [Hyphomicrobiales bacterium]|nr:MAG: hypothetical protein DCC69_06570 [Hyphomicrobiales bacterium]